MPASPYLRGRRRSLNNDNKRQLCELVASGLSAAEAADRIDVSLRTVQREAKTDEDFHHALRLAKGAPPDPLVIMQAAARVHWRAAAWLLERKDPETYGRRRPNTIGPHQFTAALNVMIEAALSAAPPEVRDALYDHLQGAADDLSTRLFPDLSAFGRWATMRLPATPLVDQALDRRLTNPALLPNVPDHAELLPPATDSAGSRTGAAQPQEATPINVATAAPSPQQPPLPTESPATPQPHRRPAMLAATRQQNAPTAPPSILSSKTHSATKFPPRQKPAPAAARFSCPPPTQSPPPQRQLPPQRTTDSTPSPPTNGSPPQNLLGVLSALGGSVLSTAPMTIPALE